MKFSSVLVAANPKKPRALELEKQVENFFLERGVKLSREAELIVAIGGDGTVLYKTHNNLGVPVFGIGSKRSFICQAIGDNWREKLTSALEKGKIEEKGMLDGQLNKREIEPCLNEYCVRSTGHRLLRFKLRVGGKEFEFRADGIIFSTPTGSTAYAYSAGGKELKEGSGNYEIVAIAPYRRTFEYEIVDEKIESELEIECEQDAMLVVDGLFEHAVKNGSVLKVNKSKEKAKFLKA
ncbi:NAD(+)/NADH kinase [Candidatus Micrarchaeota archaeon]|nr:NAD(+)/NADH kinase [Candidatus Micrarchaeota archaeon]